MKTPNGWRLTRRAKNYLSRKFRAWGEALAEKPTTAPSVGLSRWLGGADAKPEQYVDANGRYIGRLIYTKSNIDELATTNADWELRIDYGNVNMETHFPDNEKAVLVTPASFVQRWRLTNSASQGVAGVVN